MSANHAGEQNFWYVQPDCVNNRPVKQYIVRGPFATASQTTQNNKPKLTERCTRLLLRRLHVLFPINEAVASSLHSNYSFFAEIIIFHWLIYYIYMQNICVVSRVKCEELQVGCHTYYYYYYFLAEYTGVILTLTSGNVTWFYDRNCDFILKILWR